MNIAVFDTKPEDKAFLKKKLKNHKVSFYTEKLTPLTASKAKQAEVVSMFISSAVNRVVLSKLPKLKLIATRSTGFDHIDLDACKKRGVVVCNVPTYGENTVAEYAFALFLALVRKLPQTLWKTNKRDFTRKGLEGQDVAGKTMGVVGTGNIGKHLVKMAHGFDMKIIAFDIIKDASLKKYGLQYKSLDYVLQNADVLSFHVPLNKHTHHLLNKKNVKKLKKGVIVINTSRGGVIDTAALLDGLRKKIIGGVGVDVLEDERMVGKKSLSPALQKSLKQELSLADHPNVIVSPHNAFDTKEAKERILAVTVQNILSKKNKV